MEGPEKKRFGRYEILGELGRGAMGVVYKARDPQIERLVALKTILLRGLDPEAEKEFRLRFLNEAQAAGRLHHPGIVTVFDVGEEPETHDPYIVLEYVKGEALNRILAREKKLPLATAVQFAEQVAMALEYAHAQGVTHRDIKPGNILITEEGNAKIADFGIAMLNLAHLTLPGKLLGTPAYMAPEQLNGTGVDGRSDLFSLGVILYAMVTGYSPFQGDSATAVCFKVANREPVPASALELDLPRELDAVIARSMAKDRDERYQRGAELAEDLRQLQALRKSGSTTTSLQMSTTWTKKQKPGGSALQGRPAVGLTYAMKIIRAEFLKSPVRDLILGVATVILLVIVGLQSKLLVRTNDEAATVASTSQMLAGQTQAGTTSSTVEQSAQNATTSGAKQGASAKAGSTEQSAVTTKAIVRNTSGSVPAEGKANTRSRADKEVVVPFSTLELAIRHQFKEATLSVWVDNKLVLTRPLHGGTQKHLVVFGGVRGIESETVKVPAGKHTIRFQTQTADQTLNLSKTISAEFVGGADRTLQISFDKHNSAMHLDWQP